MTTAQAIAGMKSAAIQAANATSASASTIRTDCRKWASTGRTGWPERSPARSSDLDLGRAGMSLDSNCRTHRCCADRPQREGIGTGSGSEDGAARLVHELKSGSAAHSVTSPRVRGERLSCLSSGLPWAAVSDDGVEDGQKFAGDCDEGDHLWLPSGNQAIEKRFHDRIVPLGDHRAHEQSGSDGGAPTADEASAAPLAGLASERSKSRKRSNLPAAETFELGQVCNQPARDGRFHPR